MAEDRPSESGVGLVPAAWDLDEATISEALLLLTGEACAGA